jgi:arabinofuranan 3-O-arabinosyltransferase
VATLPVRLSQLSVPALAGLRAVTPDEQARLTLACGQGPALTIDGRVYQTSVSGTIGELSQYLLLRVGLCSPGGTLSFGAGRHTLTAATPGTFAVTDLSFTSIAPDPQTATTSGASRAVTIRSWQPDQRQLSIGPGAASYLEVHENYNPGWAAALNGRELTPVRLDGWQQGFIVPAGLGGTITLSFRPAAAYHLALVVSMLAVAILLAITAWSFIVWPRREAGPDAGEGSSRAVPHGWSSPPPPAAACASLGGHGRAWLGVLGVAALIFVAGGPAALTVPLLACLAWLPLRPPGRMTAQDPPARLPWLAFAGLVASGLLSAARPFGAGLLGPFGGPAQACALVALAAALTPAVAVPVRRRPASREAPAAVRPATPTAGEADR